MDRQRGDGAGSHTGLGLPAQSVGDRIVQGVRDAVVVELEDSGGGLLAQAVAFAPVLEDVDSHQGRSPLCPPRRAAGSRGADPPGRTGSCGRHPAAGFQVTPLSVTELDELTDARVEVEALVLARAVRRGDLGWESSIVAAHDQLANTPKARATGEPNGAWFSAHEHLHEQLLRGCGNGRLYAVATSLRDAAALYRRWSRPIGRDYDRDVDAEHRQLLDAVLARDENAAASILTQHIQRTSNALRSAAVDDTAIRDAAVPAADARRG